MPPPLERDTYSTQVPPQLETDSYSRSSGVGDPPVESIAGAASVQNGPPRANQIPENMELDALRETVQKVSFK